MARERPRECFQREELRANNLRRRWWILPRSFEFIVSASANWEKFLSPEIQQLSDRTNGFIRLFNPRLPHLLTPLPRRVAFSKASRFAWIARRRFAYQICINGRTRITDLSIRHENALNFRKKIPINVQKYRKAHMCRSRKKYPT